MSNSDAGPFYFPMNFSFCKRRRIKIIPDQWVKTSPQLRSTQLSNAIVKTNLWFLSFEVKQLEMSAKTDFLNSK